MKLVRSLNGIPKTHEEMRSYVFKGKLKHTSIPDTEQTTQVIK